MYSVNLKLKNQIIKMKEKKFQKKIKKKMYLSNKSQENG